MRDGANAVGRGAGQCWVTAWVRQGEVGTWECACRCELHAGARGCVELTRRPNVHIRQHCGAAEPASYWGLKGMVQRPASESFFWHVRATSPNCSCTASAGTPSSPQEARALREYEELKECTFTPAINREAPKPTGPVVVPGLGRHMELRVGGGRSGVSALTMRDAEDTYAKNTVVTWKCGTWS